ncbi:MAG: class I SAM-dependent methyltransferase [Planctomyces sp.]|nr:class I SAM-dependent methyltransferase [Planctomyces sp.]
MRGFDVAEERRDEARDRRAGGLRREPLPGDEFPGDAQAPKFAHDARPGFIDGWVRGRVLNVLRGLVGGEILLTEGADRERLGCPAEDGLQARVAVRDPALYRELLFGGSLGAAEAYLQGSWDCDDLVAFLRIACRNYDSLMRLDRGPAAPLMAALRLRHRLSRNTQRGSRRNIAAHYDLGNEFFSLFLDRDLMYSSGLFAEPGMSLDEASQRKLDAVCRRLRLQPGQHLVEIGTGWGGLAAFAARECGCRVTTTTVSRQQYEFATQRIEAQGLSDRVTVLLEDYRDLRGTYDALVSIEMVEAVGREFLPRYFAKCASLLKPEGRMLIQAITMPEQRYEAYSRSVDFIQRYIFPGGHLPSVREMLNAVAAAPGLRFLFAEQFPDSYALTLREWRRRFETRRKDVRELGFDERFLRMWEYYFCYCEAAFLERAVSVGHFLWEKNHWSA